MKSDTKKVFADNVNRLLEQSGIDRHQLADELDIKYTTLSKWLIGDTFPRADALDKIADYFRATVSELLKDERAKEQQRIGSFYFLLKKDLNMISNLSSKNISSSSLRSNLSFKCFLTFSIFITCPLYGNYKILPYKWKD